VVAVSTGQVQNVAKEKGFLIIDMLSHPFGGEGLSSHPVTFDPFGSEGFSKFEARAFDQ